MRRIIIVLGFFAIIFSGCKKDRNVETTSIETVSVAIVDANSVKVTSKIMSEGEPTISQKGVCYGMSVNPTLDDNLLVFSVEDANEVQQLGDFDCLISCLAENTTYYVRAFAQNPYGTLYGKSLSFTTPVSPRVVTVGVEDINNQSFIVKGKIANKGSSDIKMYGFCYDKIENPTIEGTHTENVMLESDDFQETISGLDAGVEYYVRAYAVGLGGVAYGEQIKVRTRIVSVVTDFLGAVTSNSAILNGNVLDDGGYDITDRGFCLSKSQNPTVADSKFQCGSGLGEFAYNVTGLEMSTEYYVRAYAVNSSGIVYGEQRSFKTYGFATVTTDDITNITSTSAKCGGNIVSGGGGAILDKGICWSYSPNPTISNSKISLGSGASSFTTTLTGLTVGVTYYVRAYATNITGTSYGSERTFMCKIIYSYVDDICGNSYRTVMIGTQVWMAENMRCNKYDTQSELPNDKLTIIHQSGNYAPYYINASDKTEWTVGSFCHPDNLSESQINKFGYLYNWGAAVALSTKDQVQARTTEFLRKRQGICPNGWHIPTRSEWGALCEYLGGVWKDSERGGYYNKGGNALKTKAGWYYENGTDTYGFSALPSGDSYGSANTLYDVGKNACFWTSSPYDQTSAWMLRLGYWETVSVWYDNKSMGYSVRCIKN
jgi:uncharacterized protein (TIGR02145 family)